MKPSIKSLLISRQSPAGVIRFDCLHRIDVIEMALCANRFGGHAELVAERSGESFVGAITEIQSDSQDVSTTVRKHARCLAQSPAAHVAHLRLAGRPGEHMSEVVARFPATTDNSPSDTPPLNRLSSNHSAFRSLSKSAPNEARERRTKVHRHPLDRNCVAGKGWDGIRPKAVATVTGDWVLTPALLRRAWPTRLLVV